ncbi:MAG: acyl-CoA thioesterase [Glaciimonas sp.]|nr:acyl-CoA thioesterase [Glaciimonas sp.]
MRIEVNKRSGYLHFQEITTRWMDNDAYGHVNNVIYYSWFDTVVNQFLIAHGVLNVDHGRVIGLVIETQCNYFAPVAFPDRIYAGLRVSKLGNSSVRYEVGIFRGDADVAAAQGHFIHVYVDRSTRRPAAIPGNMREVLESIQIESQKDTQHD